MTHAFEADGYAFIYNEGMAGDVRLVRLPGTPNETPVKPGEFAIAGSALAAFAAHAAASAIAGPQAAAAAAQPVPEPMYDQSGDFVLEGEGKEPAG